MDKRTKLRVIKITVFWIFMAYLYIYHEQIITDFKHIGTKEKWEKEEPKGQLINGKKNGNWKTYFTNGRLAAVENYKDDTLHGLQTHYSPEGGYKARSNYNMGIKVDSFLLYNSNGLLNFEEYRDSTGTPQGQFRVYDTNGQLIQLGQYKDGKFDGEFRTFYQTGKLKTIEHYRQGERIGTWIGLSTKGDTTKLEQY
jgi:antitoxin component YwqK of YwqJK toxin-antitoxin module